MSKDRVLHPKTQRQAEAPISKGHTEFYGAHKGIPASEIDANHAARNVNLIDRGKWKEVRPGSKLFTEAVRSAAFTADANTSVLTTAVTHPWTTGQSVWLKTSAGDLPAPLAVNTQYFVIRLSGTTLKLATTYANACAGTAIAITDAGTGTHKVWYGAINARIDHVEQEKFVFMFGTKVYVSDKRIAEYIPVINLNATDPSGVSMMSMSDKDIILASGSGIFRIDVTGTYPLMHRVNLPVPPTLMTDIAETTARIWGHWYIYGFARLSGNYQRNRVSDNTKLEFESGTCKVPGQEKDYAEIYFTTKVGASLVLAHVVGWMQLPDSVDEATHFTVYRTKNIGKNSGGVSTSLDSVGNRYDLMVWIEDHPVAKAFLGSVSDGYAVDVTSGEVAIGEIGDTLKLLNLDDDTTYEKTITGVNVAGHYIYIGDISGATAGDYVAACGMGRVFKASQTGFFVTISKPDAGVFVPGDKGKTIFRSDGKRSVVKDYISATKVEVMEEESWTCGCTMRPLTENFKRKFNDTVPDAEGTGRVSLSDRILAQSPLYIPQRFMDPLPNADICVCTGAFLVTGLRNDTRFFYSQIGEERFSMGYYRKTIQEQKVTSNIRHMVIFPNAIIILCSTKTLVLLTNVSSNAGRTEIGENIFKLSETYAADDYKGVVAWQTVQMRGPTRMIAVTSEPAVRYFDGSNWSEENLAIDSMTGDDSIQRSDIERIDPYYKAVSAYSGIGGYKLFVSKWIPA
jgi:hypothetical protein